eukprot:5885324-Pleurochrysis_carterae.AAC.1
MTMMLMMMMMMMMMMTRAKYQRKVCKRVEGRFKKSKSHEAVSLQFLHLLLMPSALCRASEGDCICERAGHLCEGECACESERATSVRESVRA